MRVYTEVDGYAILFDLGPRELHLIFTAVVDASKSKGTSQGKRREYKDLILALEPWAVNLTPEEEK